MKILVSLLFIVLIVSVVSCRKRVHVDPQVPLPEWVAPVGNSKSSHQDTVSPALPSRETPFPFAIVVHFDFDRFLVKGLDVTKVSAAAVVLNKNPLSTCTIYGHTCSIGTTEYNIALGERRANTVRELLLLRGIAGDRVRAVSFGEENPVSKVLSENRRAEIKVGGKGCP